MAKEYDKDIRKLFGDYKRAKSRMAYLKRSEADMKIHSDEYAKLECLVAVVDTMISQLSILQQQIIEYYYICGEPLYDIADLLHYSYYHCSNEKNEAVDELKRIFADTRFDSIIAQEFEKRYKKLEETKSGEFVE